MTKGYQERAGCADKWLQQNMDSDCKLTRRKVDMNIDNSLLRCEIVV